FRPAVVHGLRQPRMHAPGRSTAWLCETAVDPIGHAGVVEQPVAEVGILGAGAVDLVEHVGIERPGPQTLGDGEAEKAAERTAAGLELGLEPLAFVADDVGPPGG